MLSGTSSSGKSTLRKTLQNALPKPYLDAGLDGFIWMMPRRYFECQQPGSVRAKVIEMLARQRQFAFQQLKRSYEEVTID
jgi:chloramphenicol 3-O-phosphotransferase